MYSQNLWSNASLISFLHFETKTGTGSKATGDTGTSNGSIVELTATSIFIAAFAAFASTFI